MARKRMFDQDVINQDSFLDLPMEAKALYFLLGMEADDEGFINPKRVMKLHGGSTDSLMLLVGKNYIIPFESGVIVITDWKRNNYLDKNKIKPTMYSNEKSQLTYNNVTEKYELIESSNTNGLTKVKQSLTESLPKVYVEESSIEENSIVESSSSVKNLYNSDVEKINNLMYSTLNTTNTNNVLECVDYLEKLPYEVIEYALKKTARISHPSWKYAITILEDYVSRNLNNIEKVIADDMQYNSSRTKENQEETKEEEIARKTKALEEAIKKAGDTNDT